MSFHLADLACRNALTRSAQGRLLHCHIDWGHGKGGWWDPKIRASLLTLLPLCRGWLMLGGCGAVSNMRGAAAVPVPSRSVSVDDQLEAAGFDIFVLEESAWAQFPSVGRDAATGVEGARLVCKWNQAREWSTKSCARRGLRQPVPLHSK